MHLADTRAEAAFRMAARTWLEANAALRDPGAIDPFLFGGYPTEAEVSEGRKWQRRKFDAGWAGILWPAEYGGRGGSVSEQIIWEQEERRVVTPRNVSFIGLSQIGSVILLHGTQTQKEHFIRPTLTGETLWCQLFSEPGCGSDLAALETTGRREGTRWRISGSKIWISDAAYADLGFIVVRTDWDRPKHAGLSCFIVDMRAAGVQVQHIRQMSGTSNYSRVQFNEVIVDDELRIGEVNDGWKVVLSTLMYERLFVGTMLAFGGIGGPRVAHLTALAAKCEIAGRPAIASDAVRQRIAAMLVRERAIQHLSHRLLNSVTDGQSPGPEASMLKLTACALCQDIANFGFDLLARNEGPEMHEETQLFQTALLQAPLAPIAGGAAEIQRTIIAERTLGMARVKATEAGQPFKLIRRNATATSVD